MIKTIKILMAPSNWLQKDLKKNLPYKLWWDPQNILHRTQWDFTHFTIKEVNKLKGKKDYAKARKRLDEALASCYYW